LLRSLFNVGCQLPSHSESSSDWSRTKLPQCGARFNRNLTMSPTWSGVTVERSARRRPTAVGDAGTLGNASFSRPSAINQHV
jgi:hypothetical protein